MVGVEDLFRSIAFPLLRFGSYAAHAMICGSVVILLMVLRPTVRSLPDEVWEPGRRAMSRRLESLLRAAIIASALFTTLVLLLQAALIAELGTGELQADHFTAVLETTFGQWTALRYPLLAALAVLLLGRVRLWALGGLHDKRSPSLIWWLAWMGLAVALMGTSTFSGHALVATPRWLSVVNDLVHLVSGAVWFAGIIILGAVLPDGWRRSEGSRIKLLAPAIASFSHVAMVSIGVVFVTGSLNSFLHVGALNDLWDTSYGRALSVKLVLFGGILALGAFNHFRLRDKLVAAAARGTEIEQANVIRRTVAIEVALALAMMAATGVLTYLSRTKEVPTGTPTAHARVR